MLHIRHADGTSALDLRYAGHRISQGKPKLEGLPCARGEGAQTLTITLCDAPSGITVELAYTLYEDIDIIARSMRIVNSGTQSVQIDRALSACVDFE